MTKAIFRDVLLLSLLKRKRTERIWYFLKGMVFLPFLIRESRGIKGEEDMAASISASGDDIYPLF